MTDDESMSPRGSGSGRRLVLMRHAKSDWADGDLSDHERPLNRRGQRDAPAMATWLASVDVMPDLILSSTAQRTRDTVALMMDAWPCEPDVGFSDSLYLATPEAILKCIRCDAGDANCVLIVAHNPGITSLASQFSRQTVEMPTAAMAIYEVGDCLWSQLRLSTPLKMTHFMKPKAL